MKKNIFIVLLLMLTSIISFSAEINDIEKKLEMIKYPYELDFKGTPLSDALSSISKTSNISIVATSEIADLPIDLYLPAGRTLKMIIDTIKNTNGLVSRIVNNSIIVSRVNPNGEIVIQKGKVVGKVMEIDKITGIRGVTLSLGDNVETLVLSDVGGAFIIDGVSPGTYILKATLKGYKSNAEIVEVVAGQPTKIEIVLSKIDKDLPDENGAKKIKEELGKVRKENGDIRDTKMIRVVYSEPSEIKAVLQEIVPMDNIVVDEKNNLLILIGTEENIKTASNLIVELDKPARQIEVRAKIWDLNEGLSDSLGIDWNAKTINGNYDENDLISSFGGKSGLDLTFTSTGNALKASLDILKTTSDASVIAEPKIVTLNGEEAEIKVVNEEIVGYEEKTDSNGNSSDAPLFKEAGIVLTVRPIVKQGDSILIEIYSKVSKFVPEGVHAEAAEQKSETRTKVRIKDGDTITIGGLIREDTTKGVSKVPILGDIPLIGMFFKNQTSSNTKREIYIEITAKIVEDLSISAEEEKELFDLN